MGKSLGEIKSNKVWNILVKSEGYLNFNNIKDYAIVIESSEYIAVKHCEGDKVKKAKPRILLIFTQQLGKTVVSIQNNVFIAHADEGGMSPYIEPELTIENNALTIFYQYTRSNQSYTFKFINQEMLIIKAENFYVQSSSGKFEHDTYDFINNELTTETGHISDEEFNKKTISLNVKPKSLAEFKCMYDWEIIKNYFL